MIVSKYIPIKGKSYVEASDYDELLYELKHSNDRIAELEYKINTLRARCHKSAIDSFDNGIYGILHIATADELKTSNSSTDSETDILVKLPFDAMETANMLINATYKRKNCITDIDYDKDIYSIDDLEQIAEHLLVYCKHHRGGDE